jgi:hypothetical protein
VGLIPAWAPSFGPGREVPSLDPQIQGARREERDTPAKATARRAEMTAGRARRHDVGAPTMSGRPLPLS